MLPYLTDAKHIAESRFWLRFNTGEEGELDLAVLLRDAPGKLGEAFRTDPDNIKDFYLDPWPTLAWKCGYDIAPERLYEMFANQTCEKVAESHESYSAENTNQAPS